MVKAVKLTQAQLKEKFTFDQTEGVFRLRRKINKWQAGWKVGHPDTHGHIQVMVDGRFYLAHRLVWLWMYGVWPLHDIDHVDGNRANNRPSNLRKASRSENCSNSKKRADSTSGYKGVSFQKDRWRAQIQVNGKKVHIGMFSTPEEAHKAYIMAASELHGEFARTA